MAVQHLTVLHSPEFPQVFCAIIERLMQRVDTVLAAHPVAVIEKAVTRG